MGNARIRWLPGELPLAGYAELVNSGTAPLQLTGASSPAFAEIELHRSMEHQGMAMMQPVEHIDLAPGQKVELAPGGLHLMLMGRTRALQPGDHVPVTLQLGGAGTVTAQFAVQPPGMQ